MFDIFSGFENKRVDEITLKFNVSRIKKKLWLYVSVTIDNINYSYKTTDKNIINSLKIFCDDSIIIKE